MAPEVALQALIDSCDKREKIGVKYDAENDAREVFNLPTKKRIYEFIAGGGLEAVTPIKVENWRYNPKPIENPALVYSYNFYSGSLYGYLAIIFFQKTGWIMIKSFKKNTQQDPRNLAFKGLAALLGASEEGNKK